MGHLSTHVLDTMHGCPAAGMAVQLQRLDGERAETLANRSPSTPTAATTAAPLLDAAAMAVGRYRLLFDVAAYFRARGVALPRAAVPGRGAAGLRHRRRRRPLPRAAAGQPVGYSTYRGC